MAVFFVIAHGFKFTALTGTSESGNNVHIVKYEKVQREFRIVLILSIDDRIGGRFFKENTGWSRTMYTEPGQMLDNAAGSGFGKIG